MKRLFSLFNVVTLLLLAAAYTAYQTVQKPPPKPDAPKLQLAQQRDVKVKVYYSDAQVQDMKAETRTVQVTQENPGALAQAALNVWAGGPSTAGNLAVVPKGTAAPRVYIRGAHYFVDLPSAYQNLKYGSSGERILLCTLTRTLLETRGEDVTFLVNGQDVDTLGHLDLREAFTRQDCADQ
ncbi:GerMN domain-containing protein [Deinococcus puniceus]|uniref:Sporulation/spore germination protein n=1 Tax=Deinococcus puniceus TaxID=1182568 RepID=A0A172TCY6_9DEIO|nr:GerMN domain-containing protein [Deinococcus puniceus]ANE44888.1 sporulation/spore germination protein [Deinococcus puniceus]